MPLNPDFRDLLKLLVSYRVKYLIVGGYAVMHYTEPRFTKDLDIWIEASKENAGRIFKSLVDFGAPLKNLKSSDFEEEGFFYQLGRPPLRIDILMSVSGLTFKNAWPNRVEEQIDDTQAIFIGRDDLIKTKLACGRHIDLHDAEQLKKRNTSGD